MNLILDPIRLKPQRGTLRALVDPYVVTAAKILGERLRAGHK